MSKPVLIVRYNKQPIPDRHSFKYIARKKSDGKYVIGFIAIDEEIYAPIEQQKYYMLVPKDHTVRSQVLGVPDIFEYVPVKYDSIKPLSQIMEIRYYLEQGYIIKLQDDDKTIMIENEDQIPYNKYM